MAKKATAKRAAKPLQQPASSVPVGLPRVGEIPAQFFPPVPPQPLLPAGLNAVQHKSKGEAPSVGRNASLGRSAAHGPAARTLQAPREYHGTFDFLPADVSQARSRAVGLRDQLAHAMKSLDGCLVMISDADRFLVAHPEAQTEFELERVDMEAAHLFADHVAALLNLFKPKKSAQA